MTLTLRDAFDEYDVEFSELGEHRNVRAGWLGVDCPYCGPRSGKRHMGISIDWLTASCWQCGAKPAYEVLRDLGLPGRICARLVKARRAFPSEPLGERSGQFSQPQGVSALLPPHRRYLERRGFDPDELQRIWHIGALDGFAARLAWRIYIPIEWRGKPVSWTTRAIGKDPKRYIHASDEDSSIPARELLYGFDLVRHAAVLVEGPTDAWRIGPGAVARLGLGSISAAQLLLLSSIPVRAICFDAEPAARRRAEDLAARLEGFPGETFRLELESGEDPASAEEEEIEEIRQEFLAYS